MIGMETSGSASLGMAIYEYAPQTSNVERISNIVRDRLIKNARKEFIYLP